MKTGKITAKLRDAVPVCLMVNGKEVNSKTEGRGSGLPYGKRQGSQTVQKH